MTTTHKNLLTSNRELLNNFYATPITVDFGTTETDDSINVASKHRKIFISIKLPDFSTTIITKNDNLSTTLTNFPWEKITLIYLNVSTI